MKTKHKCPVCHQYEFDGIISYDTCPVCGWEDDGSQNYPHSPAANHMSLREYRLRYQQGWTRDELISYDGSIPARFSNVKENICALPCPVCGKFMFERDCSYDVCPVCGWVNDGMQIDEPDTKMTPNILSLNEYRDLYQSGWTKQQIYAVSRGQKHLCPVCGKYEFPDRNEEETKICPICGWKDSYDQELDPETVGIGQISLNEYRRRYYRTDEKEDN